jgi:hypothetical protein
VAETSLPNLNRTTYLNVLEKTRNNRQITKQHSLYSSENCSLIQVNHVRASSVEAGEQRAKKKSAYLQQRQY